MLESDEGYIVCRKGEILGAAQTALLKVFGVEASSFEVRILGWWGKEVGCYLISDQERDEQVETQDGFRGVVRIDTRRDVDNEGGIDIKEARDDRDEVAGKGPV